MNSPECGKENPDNGQSNSAPQAKTSNLVIASLAFVLLSVISLFILPHAIVADICLLIFLISIPLAFILGIISIFKIIKSKGQLKGYGWAIAGIVIPILLAVSVMPIPPRGRGLAIRMLCGIQMKGLGNAIIVYADYNNDRYPTADKWCDLLLDGGYVPEKQFKCPKNEKARCSYAINPNAEPNSPPDMVVLFETKGGWNQFGGPELLTVDNHEGEGCNILFNDFHVNFVSTREVGQLKWTAK